MIFSIGVVLFLSPVQKNDLFVIFVWGVTSIRISVRGVYVQ